MFHILEVEVAAYLVVIEAEMHHKVGIVFAELHFEPFLALKTFLN